MARIFFPVGVTTGQSTKGVVSVFDPRETVGIGAVRYYTSGGSTAFFTPLLALTYTPAGAGGAPEVLVATPTLPGGDANWRAVSKPSVTLVEVPFSVTDATPFVLQHNLGYTPTTEVFDSNGDYMLVVTHRRDANSLLFYFTPPESGIIVYARPAGL
jgi:hypothetical protein